MKMNADIFAEVLHNVFNRSLELGAFLSGMKLATWHLCIKKVADVIKVFIDLLAFYLADQKSLKDVYTSKFLIFLIPFCQNIYAVSAKDIVLSMV